jgi:choline dehydrogenase
MTATVDYIVVGSGATGSVLANRLTENPATTVLLLEAGDFDTNPKIHDIGSFVELWGSDLDWKLVSEPQAAMGDRQIVINQGKVVGGSTSINALMYVRGNRLNFDAWGAGWTYAEVLPYFKKSEDYAGQPSEFHGTGGLLKVCDCPEVAMRSPEFMAAAAEVGFKSHWDYNGERQENGAGLLQFHITSDGKRSSGASAFLTPILNRPNLKLETQAEVTRVLFDGTRAIGVEYLQNGELHQVQATREVILSAGAFQSPKLLMLSGIGAAAHLQAHDIPVLVDLPAVGQNLQDHLQLPIVFRTRDDRPNPHLLTGNVLFVNTRVDQPDAAPDLQLNFTPAIPTQLSPMLNFGGPVCIFLAILVQPESVGEVKLKSSNPQDPPMINPNYLQADADLKTFFSAIDLTRKLANAPAFAALNVGEVVPGTDDRAAIEGFIRSQATTLWHPVGTCAIGSVVDAELRVMGVEGLRVADASVMPVIPSGNTVAASFMIGEKLADLLVD